MSVNSTTLLGRVGKTPEVRTLGQQNTVKIASFTLCTGGKYKTKDGREVDDTQWHNIVAKFNLADVVEKYIDKGSQVLVIGHITYRDYTDASGNKRYVTEIVADKIEFFSSKSEQKTSSPAPQQYQTSPIEAGEPQDDDLPF